MNQNKTKQETIASKFIRIDYFAKDFKLKISKDKERFGSFFGSLLTILMTLILLFYGAI